MKIKTFFSKYPPLLLILVWFVAFFTILFVLGQLYPTEPVSPVSPIAKIQQVEETGTPDPTATDGPTPTATPTHWSSNSIEVWCDDEAVGDSPVELEIELTEGQIPLMGLNVNIQLRDANDEVLLQHASLNLIIPPLEACTGQYLEAAYDWREHENNQAIPTGTVYEYALLSYSSFISVARKLDGTPWVETEQGWYGGHIDSTPTAKEYGEYEFVRSFEWASPTPILTPTPSVVPTPTPKVIRIYLPIILRWR